MGRKLKYLIIFVGVLLILNLTYGQQAINGSRYILGYWDASGARWTKPFYASATQPATCAIGEVMFDTDATAGQNIYLCTATNTWTQVSGGGGATPAGASGDVQYNNGSGGLGAESALNYDSANNELVVGTVTPQQTCILGAAAPAGIGAGALCVDPTWGMMCNFSGVWYACNGLQDNTGQVPYSGTNYELSQESGFSYNAGTNTLTAGAFSGPVTCTDCIALGSETTGNYAGSSSEGGAATTAVALSADGTNCSAGQAPLGVDASGNAQSCFTPTVTQVDIDGDGTREVSLSGGSLSVDSDEDGTSGLVLEDTTAPNYMGRIYGKNGTGYTGLDFWNDNDGACYIFPYGDCGSGVNLGSTTTPFGAITLNSAVQFFSGGDYLGALSGYYWNSYDTSMTFSADIDNDGTGEGIRFDPDGDGTNDLVLDGNLVDCDGDGSALGYDVTTGNLVCGDDDTGGASAQVDMDGDGTLEISLATSIISLDPDEDGTLESNFDANGRFSNSAVSVDDDRDGLLAVWAEAGSGILYFNPDEDGSKWRMTGTDFLYANSGGMQLSSSGNVRVDPTDDGTAQETWDGSANTINMDLDQDGTWEYSFDGSAQKLYLDPDDDGTWAMMVAAVDADISGDGTNDHTATITLDSNGTYSPFITDPRFGFTQFKDCTTLDLDVDGIPAIEGTIAIGTTAAQLDANPQTGLTSVGYCTIPTGATSGNEFQLGWGPSTNMTTNAFIINKTNYFGARLRPQAITDASAVWVHVGAADYNADNAFTGRTDALMFQCSPWADNDGDGTMGSLDTDGTGTAAPDGDCADANEDADDCNWYVVSINGATSTNDNGCLLDVDVDGSGDCDRDGTEDDAVTQTNRTAYNTGIKCNGDVGNDGTWAGSDGSFQTLEIVSTSPTNATYSFQINGVEVYALSTNVPGNARATSGWMTRVETNMAATRTWTFDWMRWSYKRLTN